MLGDSQSCSYDILNFFSKLFFVWHTVLFVLDTHAFHMINHLGKFAGFFSQARHSLENFIAIWKTLIEIFDNFYQFFICIHGLSIQKPTLFWRVGFEDEVKMLLLVFVVDNFAFDWFVGFFVVASRFFSWFFLAGCGFVELCADGLNLSHQFFAGGFEFFFVV